MLPGLTGFDVFFHIWACIVPAWPLHGDTAQCAWPDLNARGNCWASHQRVNKEGPWTSLVFKARLASASDHELLYVTDSQKNGGARADGVFEIAPARALATTSVSTNHGCREAGLGTSPSPRESPPIEKQPGLRHVSGQASNGVASSVTWALVISGRQGLSSPRKRHEGDTQKELGKFEIVSNCRWETSPKCDLCFCRHPTNVSQLREAVRACLYSAVAHFLIFHNVRIHPRTSESDGRRESASLVSFTTCQTKSGSRPQAANALAPGETSLQR